MGYSIWWLGLFWLLGGVVFTQFFTRTFPAALYRTRWWWIATSLGSVVLAVVVGWWAVRNPVVFTQQMTPAEIDAYIASGEPFGKAGAYAIQGAIAAWIVRIDGSHSGIMGLPLFETATLLRGAGVALA